MNTIIFKILCWINGIKNPFVWEAEEVDSYKEIEDKWRFYYDHGYAKAKRDYDKMIEDIKQEIFNAIDNVPNTLSRNDADKLLKMDIQDIIDKYKEEQK